MTDLFRVLSLSHNIAPVHVREQIALNSDEQTALLQLIKETSPINDVLVLSTCNRTEIYYSSIENENTKLIKLIGIVKGNSKISTYNNYFTSIDDQSETVNYLFRVSMGLEAKVLGDIQISNQIKNAYQLSANEYMAGPFLHRLLHSIFFCNKRVSQETVFRDGAASVSYATTELISEFTNNIITPKVLILGLGEIGTDVCKNLENFEGIVYVTNRTNEKAKNLAEERGFEFVAFENYEQYIQECDVIVSSVSVNEPIITQKIAEELSILSHKFFIDMSVPRSISPSIENIPGIEVYNIDTIQNRTEETITKRENAIGDVEHIISESIQEFQDWSQNLEVSPTIKKLKSTLEEIRQEEIGKYMKSLNDSEAKAVEKVTKSMMQKIIKLPVLQLKAACQRGDAETLIDVLNDVFNLEKEPVK